AISSVSFDTSMPTKMVGAMRSPARRSLATTRPCRYGLFGPDNRAGLQRVRERRPGLRSAFSARDGTGCRPPTRIGFFIGALSIHTRTESAEHTLQGVKQTGASADSRVPAAARPAVPADP